MVRGATRRTTDRTWRPTLLGSAHGSTTEPLSFAIIEYVIFTGLALVRLGDHDAARALLHPILPELRARGALAALPFPPYAPAHAHAPAVPLGHSPPVAAAPGIQAGDTDRPDGARGIPWHRRPPAPRPGGGRPRGPIPGPPRARAGSAGPGVLPLRSRTAPPFFRRAHPPQRTA